MLPPRSKPAMIEGRQMANSSIKINRIAGALGAEVSGVDLSQSLPETVIAEIRRALLDNLVIFFHDQHLTPEQHLSFGHRFGEFQIHDFVEGMASIRRSSRSARSRKRNAISAAAGIPTSAISNGLPWVRYCTRARCRKPAATHCSPTSISPMKRYRTA
jgi:hypothetical protein